MKKPNVLIIMCDDLGYGDLSCMGSETVYTRRGRRALSFPLLLLSRLLALARNAFDRPPSRAYGCEGNPSRRALIARNDAGCSVYAVGLP